MTNLLYFLLLGLTASIGILYAISGSNGRRRISARLLIGVFIVTYCIAPIVLRNSSYSQMGVLWQRWPQFADESFLWGGFIVLLGLLALIAGASIGSKVQPSRLPMPSESHLAITSSFLLLAGFGAFLVHAHLAGGVVYALQHALVLRTTSVESEMAFVKNVAPLVLPGTYGVFVLARGHGAHRFQRLARLSFPICLTIALTVLYSRAGRLSFINFVVVLGLTAALSGHGIRLRHYGAVALGVGILALWGKQLLLWAISPESLTARTANLRDDGALTIFFQEIGFPNLSLYSLIDSEYSDWRYFRDFLFAPLTLLPQRVLDLSLPSSVSELNTQLLNAHSTVPVDVLSLGFYSFGVPGVAMCCLGLGATAAAVDRFWEAKSPYHAVLRSMWLLFLSFRVLYADPYLAIIPAFPLLAFTASNAIGIRFRSRSARMKNIPPASVPVCRP